MVFVFVGVKRGVFFGDYVKVYVSFVWFVGCSIIMVCSGGFWGLWYWVDLGYDCGGMCV